MRRLSALATLYFMITQVFCQVLMNDSLFSHDQRFLQPKKFNWGVTLGSEFSSASGFGSALNSYVAPHISYNLNKRISVGGGLSIVQTNYFGVRSYFQNEQNAFSNGSFTSAMLFVNGQYLVNDRLTIYGSAFKQFPITKDPLPYNPFNPVSPNGAQGVNFNVSYKVGKNLFIQTGFRYTQGVNSYSPNPFYNDPFRPGPFIPGYGMGNTGW